jgi:hypothetical protein
VKPIRSQTEADEDRADRLDQQSNRRYTIGLSLFTLIVLGFQIWLMVRQNGIIAGQTAIMKEQADHMRDGLTLTRQSNDASAASADAAKKSVAIADRTMRLDLRAWLHVTGIEFWPNNKTGATTLVIDLLNTGRLPAQIGDKAIERWMGEPMPLVPNVENRVWFPEGAVVPPGRAMSLHWVEWDEAPYSAQKWRDIYDGRLSVNVAGAIRYTTGFPDTEGATDGEVGFAFTYDVASTHLEKMKRFFIAAQPGYNYSK